MGHAIFWFRRDLRLSDNPGLIEAAKEKFLPIFIIDTKAPQSECFGAAGRCWLHSALAELNHQLGGHLHVFSGDALTVLQKLVKQYSVNKVIWSESFEPWQRRRDKQIKSWLVKKDIEANTYNTNLLWHPEDIKNLKGANYLVFTPFWKRGCLTQPAPREPLSRPRKMDFIAKKQPASALDGLGLLTSYAWEASLMRHWSVGERAGKAKIKKFVAAKIVDYASGRDIPSAGGTSELSPYLHWGHVSPNQVWYAVKQASRGKGPEVFLSEIGWREFAYNLLYHYPDMHAKNLQKKFDGFPWKKNIKYFKAWKKGLTGYPIVDAGMRQLYQTGYMHNRVRMIVASFLVKNLSIHWREGEKWFRDCLVDADLASNAAGWQWVAGCGVDAAPFFRIFNPVTQAKKFDPRGLYIKQYIPELESLPDKYIACPWGAPEAVLQDVGIVLGEDYPLPIVDLQTTRDAAMKAYNTIKGKA